MRRWLAAIIAVTAILVAGQTARAHGPHGGHGYGFGWVRPAPCYRPAVVVPAPVFVPARVYGPPVVYRYYYRPPATSFYYFGRHFGFGMAF